MKITTKKSARFFTLGSLLALFAGSYLYLIYAPDFGAYEDNLSAIKYAHSPNYKEQQFRNPYVLPPRERKGFGKSLYKVLFAEREEPARPVPVKFDPAQLNKADTSLYLTWFGHSAFLIELEGKRILIDPMFSERASPLPIGPQRFPYAAPIPIEAIGNIDLIILSHDHYDHLDYTSILQLKDRTSHFLTGLGVGEHLKRWGVPEAKITELDWWENYQLDSLNFTATPAQHFSGRRMGNRNVTLWASWAIRGQHNSLFFSGDGGYNSHFGEIGKKLGPFDLALVECGQYNTVWKDMHMMPEESVQAGVDVGASVIMPIHWGAFTLSIHGWQEPPLRFIEAAKQKNIPYVHPFIGERMEPLRGFAGEQWWTLVSNEL